MKNTLRKNIILLTLGLVLVTPLYAATDFQEEDEKVEKDDNRNPYGCLNTGHQFDLNTLKLLPDINKPDTQSLYMFYNFSNQEVSLYQMLQKESSRSMYFNHAIQAGNWTGFATSEAPVKYICTIKRTATNYGEVVDCSQHIRVCQFVKVKFGLNNRGNFWLVNSSTRNGAVREVVRYGIIPDFRGSDKPKKTKNQKKIRASRD